MPYLYLMLFISLLLLYSCGDTIVEASNDPKTKSGPATTSAIGSISVIAVDAVTGLPITNANVMMLGRDNDPKKINSGILYENMPFGKDYVFHIDAADYASIKCKADVDSSASGSVIEARLPKLGAKLQGSIAYIDLSTNATTSYPAGSKEAKIRMKLNIPDKCELLEPYKETTTGLNGTYFFDSLPELTSYDLFALETSIDNIAYRQFLVQGDGVLGLSGDIAKAPIGIYRDAFSQEEFRLISAPDTVTQNGKISLLFSKDINKSRTSSSTFSITGIGYAIDAKWNGERTFEVAPVDGIWEIDNEITIANTAELYATDGTVLYPSILAKVTVTNGILGKMSTLWVENAGTGTSLNLKGDSLDVDEFRLQWQGLIFRWNKVANATNYAVYSKCADKVNYTQINANSVSDTLIVFDYTQVYYCIAQNKQASFFVQAKNTRQQVNSEIITITGYVKPPPEP